MDYSGDRRLLIWSSHSALFRHPVTFLIKIDSSYSDYLIYYSSILTTKFEFKLHWETIRLMAMVVNAITYIVEQHNGNITNESSLRKPEPRKQHPQIKITRRKNEQKTM